MVVGPSDSSVRVDVAGEVDQDFVKPKAALNTTEVKASGRQTTQLSNDQDEDEDSDEDDFDVEVAVRSRKRKLLPGMEEETEDAIEAPDVVDDEESIDSNVLVTEKAEDHEVVPPVDHNEKPRAVGLDPTVVPRRTAFFLHDVRSSDFAPKDDGTNDESRTLWRETSDDKAWVHDKFSEITSNEYDSNQPLPASFGRRRHGSGRGRGRGGRGGSGGRGNRGGRGGRGRGSRRRSNRSESPDGSININDATRSSPIASDSNEAEARGPGAAFPGAQESGDPKRLSDVQKTELVSDDGVESSSKKGQQRKKAKILKVAVVVPTEKMTSAQRNPRESGQKTEPYPARKAERDQSHKTRRESTRRTLKDGAQKTQREPSQRSQRKTPSKQQRPEPTQSHSEVPVNVQGDLHASASTANGSDLPVPRNVVRYSATKKPASSRSQRPFVPSPSAVAAAYQTSAYLPTGMDATGEYAGAPVFYDQHGQPFLMPPAAMGYGPYGQQGMLMMDPAGGLSVALDHQGNTVMVDAQGNAMPVMDYMQADPNTVYYPPQIMSPPPVQHGEGHKQNGNPPNSPQAG